MINITVKTLGDKKYTILWWSIGVVLLNLVVVLFYPSVSSVPEYNQILQEMPPALLNLFAGNITSFTSPEGYLNSQLFFLLLPFVFLGFNLLLGSESIAREERRGTLDLILSNPVPRWRFVIEKFASITVLNAVLGLAVLSSLVVGAWMVDMDVSAWNLLDVSISLMVLGIFFGALATALSAATGKNELSMGITGAVGVAAYMLNALAPVVDELEPYRELSAFYYYIGNNPIINGLEPWDMVILLVVSGLFLFVGILVFERRDLGI
ncbi:ABC transporter permease subunit [Methanobacterium aggregans]|uniref:ABC transporter permease subunit n=2 Tax=Methanobacterium aggregans TaxID=1615586 RepID=UPI001AE1CD12|nr:ABC transporter permease subunit [Methanobacterium aggregans]MBP2046826.1 ABC-2 type transport system permease protein [Methanobacterium aggregans]